MKMGSLGRLQTQWKWPRLWRVGKTETSGVTEWGLTMLLRAPLSCALQSRLYLLS